MGNMKLRVLLKIRSREKIREREYFLEIFKIQVDEIILP